MAKYGGAILKYIPAAAALLAAQLVASAADMPIVFSVGHADPAKTAGAPSAKADRMLCDLF